MRTGMLRTGHRCEECYGSGKFADRECHACVGTGRELTPLGRELLKLLRDLEVPMNPKNL
jgi:hypothetical protein